MKTTETKWNYWHVPFDWLIVCKGKPTLMKRITKFHLLHLQQLEENVFIYDLWPLESPSGIVSASESACICRGLNMEGWRLTGRKLFKTEEEKDLVTWLLSEFLVYEGWQVYWQHPLNVIHSPLCGGSTDSSLACGTQLPKSCQLYTSEQHQGSVVMWRRDVL